MITKREGEVSKGAKQFYASRSDLEMYSKPDLTQVERKVFEKFDKRGKVLDVGCAAGRVAISLSKSDLMVVGIDFVPEFIKKATENAQVHKNDCSFLVADATNLPFKDGVFDYVICTGFSLPTLASPLRIRKVILEMARVLKANGEFFANALNRLCPGKYGLVWIGHIVRFLVRVPRRIWRMLKGQDCTGLYLGDVSFEDKSSKAQVTHHWPSKGELKKAMEMAGLRYEILTDEEFLHGKSFKAMFSPALEILGGK